MARYNRKNRAIISGILVGVASIFALASHFDLEFSDLSGFMLATLLFFVLIVLLAALTLLLFKGLPWLWRRIADRKQHREAAASADNNQTQNKDG